VVVFGDSLSDVGTYRVGPIAQLGGGKFTTNPGPIWCESVGLLLGTAVTPFRQGLGGVSTILGGTGFAMGGSRVSRQPGILCKPDPTTGACTAALTIPVTEQLSDYLTANDNHFSDNQLVFVLAGANDILFQLGALQAKVQAGVPFPQAQDEALAEIRQAASDLTGAVQRIIDHGGTRVAVLNIPDIADSPLAKLPDTAPLNGLIAAMVQLFNETVAASLAGSPVVLVDLNAELKRVLKNPAAFHVTETNLPACDAAKIAVATGGVEVGGSSLYCSASTLVGNLAPLTYLFADVLHPTTLGHLILARRVVLDLLREGLL
jgi:phospholipase/lecithinase/hemolysin